MLPKAAPISHCLVALICAGLLVSAGAVAGEERIVDARSGQTLSQDQLRAAIADSDYLLLGELHDNPAHHQRRGELLAKLPGASVVAEHLQLGQQLKTQGPLLGSLENAGFDAKSWRWPLHDPLFSAVRNAGLPLSGGNIPRATARAVVRDGSSAIPAELTEIVASNPLTAASTAALDAELLHNHCGQVPETMIPGLRLAQQTRDAAMFSALRQSSGRPAVLLAGNGHVRTDYGVPRLLRRHRPDSRVVSIGFLEDGAAIPPDGRSEPYDYLWITEPASRTDPCADFKRPAQ